MPPPSKAAIWLRLTFSELADLDDDEAERIAGLLVAHVETLRRKPSRPTVDPRQLPLFGLPSVAPSPTIH